jgi:hypothetical protein
VLGNATVHVAFAADDLTTVDILRRRAIAVEGGDNGRRGQRPSTIRPIVRSTSSIPTATIAKQSAMGRESKSEASAPYSPNLLEEVFWEVG